MDLGSIFQAAALGISTIAALGWGATSIFTLGQNREALITSFGKHVRTEKEPGLHLKQPWPFQEVKSKIRTDLLQVTEKLDTKTKDDLFVALPITIQYSVEDPATFFFKNADGVENMKKAVSAAVRTATSGKQFQELYSDRDELSKHVIENIAETVKEYGIGLRRIIIDEPTAPQAVQNSFNEVRASERLMEAAKNKAAAHKIEIVARAEAEKESDILRGQGKAGFRKELFGQYGEQIESLVGKGVSREEAIKVMLDTMHQDTLRDIGHAGNMVIVSDSKTSTAEQLAAMQALRHKPSPEQDNRGGGASSPAFTAP